MFTCQHEAFVFGVVRLHTDFSEMCVLELCLLQQAGIDGGRYGATITEKDVEYGDCVCMCGVGVGVCGCEPTERTMKDSGRAQ